MTADGANEADKMKSVIQSSVISALSAGRIWFGFLLGLMAARAETLTVATYNIENYGPANRMTEAGFRKDYPKPEAEKRALRAVIRALHADVLVLQEMGGQPYLDELRRDLKDRKSVV